MKKDFTRMMFFTAVLASVGVPIFAQNTEKPVADMLDVKFNTDGTAEDISAMKNPIEVVGSNLGTYYNDGFGFVIANFKNEWGASKSSGYRVDYEQNTDFQAKLADGHSLEMVVMADYPSVKDGEIKPFSSMQSGGTGFLITNNSRGNVMTFLPNVSADGSSKWNWCTSGISPEKKIYYHFIGVWNQEEGKAYIYCNGQLMNTITTDKVFRFPSDGSKWFCIGGDPSKANVEAAWRGDIAVARIYSEPLTGEQATTLWESEKDGVENANKLVYKQYVEEGRAYVEADGFLAYSADIEAYTAQLDHMDELIISGELTTLSDEYKKLQQLRSTLSVSAAAYQTYKDEVDQTSAYLEENKDFEGDARTLLEEYLQSDEEPGETFANGGALYIIENHTLNVEQIKAETENLRQMLKKAIETGVKSGVEVTNLLTNSDFSEGLNGWKGTAMTGYIKSATTGFTAAEAWAKGCDMYQTLENRENGVYVMEVNGAYRPYGDRYSKYYAGQVYLNNVRLFLPTVYENYLPLAEVRDGENCYITKTDDSDGAIDYEIYDNEGASTELVGYAIHGRTSMANAASAGRALNYLVTKVTDGTLTVGVKNPNTNTSSDWVGISNIHIKYYDSLKDAEPYLDKTLECMVARATTIINFKPSTSSDYAQKPGCPKEVLDKVQAAIDGVATCQTPDDKYALIETFSTLFDEVFEARKLYVEMANEAVTFDGVVNALDEAQAISPEDYEKAKGLYDEAMNAYENGTYTIEQTKNLDLFGQMGFRPELVDGVYQIANNGQLAYFGLKATTGVRGQLTADISNFSLSQMIANFYGILDGNGHKITMNMTSTQRNSSLINVMQSNSEVHNLVIDGDITTSDKFAAGVAASTQQGCRISNVACHVKIHSDVNGDGTHAGLVAVISGYTEFENCLFDGAIIGSNTKNCGGLAGWHSAASKMINCLQVADLQILESGTNVLGRVPAKYIARNTYYKTPFGELSGIQATEEQLKSGEICYLLNQGNTENPVWFQNIGSDNYPVLDATHQTVGKTSDGLFTNDKNLFHKDEVQKDVYKADLLDVVFNEDGTATDVSPMQNEITLLGEAPTVAYNETYKRNMATFSNDLGSTGKSAFKIDYDSNQAFKDALSCGHTLEAIVKVNYEGEIQNVEMKPFSSMEAGGTGFLVCKASGGRKNELTFLPNISVSGDNTWKYANSGIIPEAGTYYHLIGVYDEANAKACIYIDGQLCKETDAVGIFRLPNAGCRWFAIGGDPGSGDKIQAAWNGDIVMARIYSHPMNTKDVEVLCAKLHEETAIENVATTETRAKDGIYTINGIRVQKTAKGLYIINGKKMLVK